MVTAYERAVKRVLAKRAARGTLPFKLIMKHGTVCFRIRVHLDGAQEMGIASMDGFVFLCRNRRREVSPNKVCLVCKMP